MVEALKEFHWRNSKVTMQNNCELEPILLCQGRELRVYHMRVNGASDFEALQRELGYPNSASEADANFIEHLVKILRYIADNGFRTPEIYFKKLQGEIPPDLWEIRRRRGRKNHRLYGFMVEGGAMSGDELGAYYIVRHDDKRQDAPKEEDLRFVRWVRDCWSQTHYRDTGRE